MNTVMAGMIPTMVIFMSRDMASMHASWLRFWGIMSLAMLVAFAVAYPVNLWLVVRLKHGMATVRALGHGGHDVAVEKMAAPMPGMKHWGWVAWGIAAGSVATPSQIAAMRVLMLLALAAGVIIATLFGQWTM